MSIKLSQRADLSAEVRLEEHINNQTSLSRSIAELQGYTFLDLKSHTVDCLNATMSDLSEIETDCLAEIIVENPSEVTKSASSKLALRLFYRCNPELFRVSDDLVSSADFVDAAIDSEGVVKEVEVIRAFFSSAVARGLQRNLDTKGGTMTLRRNMKLLKILAENSTEIEACIKAIKKLLTANMKFMFFLIKMQKLQTLALGDNSKVIERLNASILELATSLSTVSAQTITQDQLDRYIDTIFNQIINRIRTIILASYGIVENKSGIQNYSFVDSVFHVKVSLKARISRFDAIFYTKDVPRIRRLLPVLKQELNSEFFERPKTIEEAMNFLTSLLTDPDLIYFLSNRMSTSYYTDPNFNKLLDPENVEVG